MLVGQWARSRTSNQLSITYKERKWTAKLQDLGVHAKVAASVEQAYRVGRDESFLRLVAASFGLGVPEVELEFKADPRAIDPVLAKIAKVVNVPARNAGMKLVDGSFKIESEVGGIKLDEEATKAAVASAIEAGSAEVAVVMVPDVAEVLAKDLAGIDTVLASYTTLFPAWNKDRTHNIRIASAEIDGTLVMPGKIFSYNKVVGPREKNRGYRDAPIFENGMLVPGTGGGVCQVSSTLYNAVLLANLEIVQRSHHSSQVSYVPKGRDATVVYGLIDLKLKNTTSTPVYVATSVSGNRMGIQLYGSSKDKADVSVEVVGTKSSDQKSSVTVYRTVKKDGETLERQLVSRDTYRPVKVVEAKPKPTEEPKPDQQKPSVESTTPAVVTTDSGQG